MHIMCVLIVVLPLFIVPLTSQNSSIFVPTNDWKEVLPGQTIPPGLHVRQNLRTKYTEAALIDKVSNVTDIISGGLENSIVNSSTYLRAGDAEKPNNYSTERFRSYEELMEDFQKINMNVKTDAEIMSDIVMEIKQGNSTVERLLLLLEDLSYYLHQIDNSKIFSESGFELLTYHLYHPSYEVIKAALKAIGAATQGNSDVKVVALQGGVLDHLHSILKASINKQNSSEYNTLLLSGVSALSSLLRDFPSAQKQFFSASGLLPTGFELLAQLSHLNTLDASRDLRVRILTFLTDLYSERLSALSAFEKDPVDTKKYIWNLYASIPFEERFLMHGFCETLRISLLQDVQEGMEGSDLSIPTNHDIREKVITACLKLFNLCDWASLDYPNKQHIQSLLDSLIREYKLRSRNETNDIDSYFTDMLHKALKLRSMVVSKGLPKSDL
ncbi:hypothetical protein MN116_002054 [Schistosoma mekongi]|uniref:Nucleotide exchange factor SIL1 n=1 Tax=Schistosoma mekongi TaxID=38744 RepID=A0AAE1ZIZ0_SCHME|nr:hypothetical protein MN116_002054 [Schistosoma mekongi]